MTQPIKPLFLPPILNLGSTTTYNIQIENQALDTSTSSSSTILLHLCGSSPSAAHLFSVLNKNLFPSVPQKTAIPWSRATMFCKNTIFISLDYLSRISPAIDESQIATSPASLKLPHLRRLYLFCGEAIDDVIEVSEYVIEVFEARL
ncbi:hypothetical protein Hanom_Chr01g00029461 [Helianthus anomalus]